jgi:hypothetical protein
MDGDERAGCWTWPDKRRDSGQSRLCSISLSFSDESELQLGRRERRKLAISGYFRSETI